jgi:hypothetical protein
MKCVISHEMRHEYLAQQNSICMLLLDVHEMRQQP